MKRKTASLFEIISCADKELNTTAFEDWSAAMNGLQVENNGQVMRIAAAVDANEMTLRRATEQGADLLIVHHGLFWRRPLPLVGAAFRRVQWCMKNNLAVYSSHLPLDAHPSLGNNALLARALELKNAKPFLEVKGNLIGRWAKADLPRDVFVKRVKKATQSSAKVIEGGPSRVRRIGVVSGGAGDLEEAVALGLDTVVTGEGKHDSFSWAHENGVNLIYAGHYATETFGVKALAAFLARRFKLPWKFVDCPSGM
ncbi:MAG: Nif3-like dinuclear metal center hexameric protein [bacterium]